MMTNYMYIGDIYIHTLLPTGRSTTHVHTCRLLDQAIVGDVVPCLFVAMIATEHKSDLDANFFLAQAMGVAANTTVDLDLYIHIVVDSTLKEFLNCTGTCNALDCLRELKTNNYR